MGTLEERAEHAEQNHAVELEESTLEDFEDLRELRKEREETMSEPTRSLREIGRDLGFEPE
ncbi:MAG: hypothetical protein V1792_06920 [Pseudomonadota bacterium]